ncbi:DEAD/DEAH box helicase [Shouchella clausii]|uniref:DEAD/DEAH box helicase n=1 Tax=Shouchella TaxID=2893057 RepID=UPI0004E65C80|nr:MULTISPECIES: DEAD/DEAH box helicase [Shouchella]MCM3312795.1 DEAD/DEAH box helicase [Psychrobacillus sp. MER TA 17]ALA55177.1 ATP-dependent RNA helicase [Shouchella clausii]KKI84646.1 ATP-dependent helicase [Shouchella clausii]MBU3231597.1 DEAD/DEAH box helicase [Shouchella clausii]MBU3265119.1 DEAD/DEAH box helicase [Shouchella clausii]
MFKRRLPQLLNQLKKDEHVSYWKEIAPLEAKTVPFPAELDFNICQALRKKGIGELYTHQAEAFEKALANKHFVAVTPTASGKSLCYNLPVLQEIAASPHSRALYLFPTKALAQDQMSDLHGMIADIGMDIKCHTYDGDTAPQIRTSIRKAGHIVLTNPDMLHAAILPHHTKWVSFFEHLRYIVIDELHTYRGVFGSHVANVIARLKRICAYYGANPQFICTSATIANPKELAQELTGSTFDLIDDNGAPRGKKHFLFYNPPLVNEPLQIRQSAVAKVNELAGMFLKEGIQTIVFAKSRVRVELILSRLQELTKRTFNRSAIRGYRGGYLPKQRREIERGLRSGEIKGVVSTNALELGVDIGQLEVCIMTGYPGSIASSWQQAGRAGRRQKESCVIMVAASTPLDQYIIKNPHYFFERPPETARLNPHNLVIFIDHLKCAAYELPFSMGDVFGDEVVDDYLDYLTEQHVLHANNGKWHWMSDAFPAHGISLRSASQENVVIIDQSDVTNHRVIGEMDRFSAMTLLHEEAIYLHEGVQYQVEQLDWDEKKAFVREVSVEYFTDANLAVSLRVLEEDESREEGDVQLSFGDVSVTGKATIFKKLRISTLENIGSGPIHLPEEELHTNGMWLSFKSELVETIGESDFEEALVALAHLLHHVAPVRIMCDRGDIHVVPQRKATHSGLPTIFLYDSYPGGIGLAKEVYERTNVILSDVAVLLDSCECESGCPSCVGSASSAKNIKVLVKMLVRQLQKGSMTI